MLDTNRNKEVKSTNKRPIAPTYNLLFNNYGHKTKNARKLYDNKFSGVYFDS